SCAERRRRARRVTSGMSRQRHTLSPPRRASNPPSRRPFAEFFAKLGPGLITGAADDDPSGISTYSIAGATFGYLTLWTALFSFPLATATELMCARLALVTGRGLAGVIRRRYKPWVTWSACALVAVANTINIAADLEGMADSTSLVTKVPAGVWVLLYT